MDATDLDRLTAQHTAFDSFAELLAGDYTPTMRDRSIGETRLANAYDDARIAQGKAPSWRPYLIEQEARALRTGRTGRSL